MKCEENSVTTALFLEHISQAMLGTIYRNICSIKAIDFNLIIFTNQVLEGLNKQDRKC